MCCEECVKFSNRKCSTLLPCATFLHTGSVHAATISGFGAGSVHAANVALMYVTKSLFALTTPHVSVTSKELSACSTCSVLQRQQFAYLLCLGFSLYMCTFLIFCTHCRNRRDLINVASMNSIARNRHLRRSESRIISE